MTEKPPKGQTWKVLAGVGCLGVAGGLLAVILLLVGMGLFSRRTEANKQLARQIPSWVLLYPDAQRREPTERSNLDPRKVDGTVILFTSRSPERVIDFYTHRLPALGFDVEPLLVEEDQLRLRSRAHRGGRELEVSTGSNSQNTWINLRYRWDR